MRETYLLILYFIINNNYEGLSNVNIHLRCLEKKIRIDRLLFNRAIVLFFLISTYIK